MNFVERRKNMKEYKLRNDECIITKYVAFHMIGLGEPANDYDLENLKTQTMQKYETTSLPRLSMVNQPSPLPSQME